jgi:hypothetical protein
MEFVCIRHDGKIYKIIKAPQETDEKTIDRAWYIAKNTDNTKNLIEMECLSHMWANHKYYGMTYNNVSHYGKEA